MSDHREIERIAALSFAEHDLTKGPGFSWRMGRPRSGNYAFRVTWGPGVLVVSGDIGRAVYEVWPGLSTLWDAVDFIDRAGFHYLCEKSGFKKEFDREATVAHLIQIAYADLRCGSEPAFFRQVCKEYFGDVDNPLERKEAARAFRDDQDLTAERVYNITGDFEAPSYSYPSEARWTYEAVNLWARTMKVREPRWHRVWRSVSTSIRREVAQTKRAWRAAKHFRPALYGRPYSGAEDYWVRVTYTRDGAERARMAAVCPLRLLGIRFGWAGLWREAGSSWPIGHDKRDAQFTLIGTAGGAS